MQGVKHLIQCHCILPQYRRRKDPVFHKFVVFSLIDDSDQVVPKVVACNNCGAIHRVVEIGRSEIVTSKESSQAVITESDLAVFLPTDLVDLFRMYKVDLATWEQAAWILNEERWGTTITLTREVDEDQVQGKILTFLGPDRFRVDTFCREELVK